MVGVSVTTNCRANHLAAWAYVQDRSVPCSHYDRSPHYYRGISLSEAPRSSLLDREMSVREMYALREVNARQLSAQNARHRGQDRSGQRPPSPLNMRTASTIHGRRDGLERGSPPVNLRPT